MTERRQSERRQFGRRAWEAPSERRARLAARRAAIVALSFGTLAMVACLIFMGIGSLVAPVTGGAALCGLSAFAAFIIATIATLES